MSLSSNRIAFLFGAGISYATGMPKTEEITEQILSGKDIYHHSDENFYLGKPPYAGGPDEHVRRAQILLKWLKKEICSYYSLYYANQAEQSINYEDLYFMVSQIRDSELKDVDNPAVQPLIDKILPEIQPFLHKTGNVFADWQVHEFFDNAVNYIFCVVWHMLRQKPKHLRRLNALIDACLDDQTEVFDIFTLNHDTVLEQCLAEKNIEIVDGFSQPVNKVRYWNPKLLENASQKIRFFKLHGSINWFVFQTPGGDWDTDRFGIPEDWGFWHTKNPEGKRQWPQHGKPLLLIGTFNKMLRYTSSIYAHLHHQFYRSLGPLGKIKRLILCGYGFGDKGINTRIIEWLYACRDNKIIVIHPNPEDLKRQARGAIAHKWDLWIAQNRLIVISKKIEETSWAEIKNALSA